MGSELVERSPELEGQGDANSSAFSYTKMFWDVLPSYLAIGMSQEEFFNGDPQLAAAYRKAQKIRLQQENERLWLMGMYTYQSILSAAPRLNSFKPKPPEKYPQKPLELFPNEPYQRPKNENFDKVALWARRVNAKRKENGRN